MAIDKWQQHLLQSDPYPTRINLFASQIKFTPENIEIQRWWSIAISWKTYKIIIGRVNYIPDAAFGVRL